MKRYTAYITVALVMVLVVAALSIRLFFREQKPAPAAADETPAATVAETEAPPPPTETPVDTPTPSPTLTPPVVTPSPPPPPTIAPTVPPTPTLPPATASSSFSSVTGTSLNLIADWRSYTDGSGNRKLRVDLSAQSYAFSTDALWNALELTVNGVTYSANSPAVNYTGESLRSTPLASFTVDVPSGNVSLSAVWHYKGAYSGVELEDISAYATVSIP